MFLFVFMDNTLPKLNVFVENSHLENKKFTYSAIRHKLPYDKSTLFEGASICSPIGNNFQCVLKTIAMALLWSAVLR